jgi:hypothetical protein
MKQNYLESKLSITNLFRMLTTKQRQVESRARLRVRHAKFQEGLGSQDVDGPFSPIGLGARLERFEQGGRHQVPTAIINIT